MKDKRLVVFDLDGTLLDTLTDLTNAVNYALSQFGFAQHCNSEIRNMIGNGAEILISRALPCDKQELKEQTFDLYSTYYDNHLLDNTLPYKGMVEVLTALRSNGIEVGVYSNKNDNQLKRLCETLLKDNYNYAVGRQRGGPRKPDPFGLLDIMHKCGADAQHTVFVGDSTVDIDTAKNGNVPCISVDWGYNDRIKLQQHGAQCIVSTPEHLLNEIFKIL